MDRIPEFDKKIGVLEVALQGLRIDLEKEDRAFREGRCSRADAFDLETLAFEKDCTERLAARKPYWVRQEVLRGEAHRKRLSKIDRSFARMQEKERERLRKALAHDERQLAAAKQEVLEEDKRKLEAFAVERDLAIEHVDGLRELAGEANRGFSGLARQCSVKLEPPESGDKQSAEAWDLEEIAVRVEEASKELTRLQRSRWTGLARSRFFWIASLACAGACGIAFTQRGQVPFPALAVSAGLALICTVSILVVHLLHASAWRRISRSLRHSNELLHAAFDQLDLQAAEIQLAHDESCQAQFEVRIARILAVEEGILPRLTQCKREHAERQEWIQKKYHRLRARVAARRETCAKAVREEAQAEHKRLAAELESARAVRAERHAQMVEAFEQRHRERNEFLESAWKSKIEALVCEGRDASAAARAQYPAWADLGDRLPAPADAFPKEIPVAGVCVPVQALKTGPYDQELPWPDDRAIAWPLALSFPERGHLFIQSTVETREAAQAALLGAVVRLLTAFPAGKAKFTLIDPAGLGKAFSGLTSLVDFDESLVGPRVWTEAGHIEERLAELTEHLEKVIQKYLRNRYNTIAEYNSETGVLQEPYRFLVISDFPTGFSELALERLASIFNSGAPCGVHVLMIHDARKPLPAAFKPENIREHTLVVHTASGGFAARHGRLALGSTAFVAPPSPEQLPAVLEQAGRASLAASRVELDFSLAAPQREELWSRSAKQSFRVPIGRAGADRIQELELGRGTAQHALIAGRTGSGKSTLFHVMVTNAALWYSPEEVEFYLIDFKKGVEFKTYANHGLPHARVIAIESDREFGLSVLRRIDEELTRRGELFRAAGVHDLPTFRTRKPGVTMPRSLLLIDEFQEFFTEDDAIARDAALLLDRFVRQGRAFGMHALLGSQTLSGVYSLAKSTLGQIGVRIAMQCNEMDSYLILSEDNAAARLLSRPGEAIYNDQSGMVEGNNPFQVVWLPEEVQREHLQAVQERKWQSKLSLLHTVVFEGNAPADLKACGVLDGVLQAAPAESPVCKTWLGEPNAIKGPTEVRYAPEAGSNLLIVGQRKDAVPGLAAVSALSLAAAHPGKAARLLLVNGLVADTELHAQTLRLREIAGNELELVDYREIPRAIDELERSMLARQEGSEDPGVPVFLFILGLQRVRALRQEDAYAFSTSKSSGPNTGEQFANLLRSGPEQHMHTIVWCDTLNNFNRALGRAFLREFDMRVLFQMSAADSAELVDAPAANHLGMHNALLAIESTGLMEKFRPFAYPPEDYLEEIRRALQARQLAAKA